MTALNRASCAPSRTRGRICDSSSRLRMGRQRGLRRPGRVVICGGGVAAVEALLALRALMKVVVEVHLVAPNRQFVYQPLAVAAPFELAETHLFELAEISCRSGRQAARGLAGARRRGQRGASASRAAPSLALRRRWSSRSALSGAEWLEGALHFGGAESVAAFVGAARGIRRAPSSACASSPGRRSAGRCRCMSLRCSPPRTWPTGHRGRRAHRRHARGGSPGACSGRRPAACCAACSQTAA